MSRPLRFILMALALAAGAAATLALSSGSFPGRRGTGEELIGQPAPPLSLADWLDRAPLELDELAGRVLLVRWWTDTCPFCSTTAPALNELDARYRERGLTVVGVFHPKPPGDRDPERVRRMARRFGFGFPVASDPDWSALRRWWLDHEPRGFTSVTFLVDRAGVIRYVHPGGEFHAGGGGPHWPDHASCEREYREIVATIESLLEERAPGPAP